MAGWIGARRGALAGLLVYALAWAASAFALQSAGSEDFGTAIVVAAVYGAGFSLVAWLCTLGERAPAIPVRRPALEAAAVLAFMAAYAVFFTGFGLNAFHAAFKPGRTEAALLVALKLLVHVAAPVLLLLALGAKPGALFTVNARSRGFWLCLVILGAASLGFMTVVSPSLKHIAALNLTPASLGLATAGAFAWLAVEAGLCEEFLFRAVLQTRLAAAIRSEAGAVFLAALVFALAHVPGLYMRAGADVSGHSQSLVQVIAYAIAVLSPIGLSLGFVWVRTRSLLLVVLLHALVDLLPNIPDFAKTWMLPGT
ncbi:MAG TPA: CPBP family intramembrane glutamic endopeptidase [Caulobacteraceae bacterium]|nr:CPBP family intramembrane glutamic endopeptidase [Caulobacteraceae bacterium]